MLVFVIRRLLQSVFVMLSVALIAFALFNYIGDPIANMVGQDTSVADRERLLRRPVCTVCRPCSARQFRALLPAGPPGRPDHPRKDAGDP
jgi:hypothetical protein